MVPPLGLDRQREIDKYVAAYGPGQSYGMGDKRRQFVTAKLCDMVTEGVTSVLDIGCGRAESLRVAEDFSLRWRGYEVVDSLCDGVTVRRFDGVHEIPEESGAWQAVTAFDVMEHLLEADLAAAVREMWRVCSDRVALTVAWFPHRDYHITTHKSEWWDMLFRNLLPDADVYQTDGWTEQTAYFELRRWQD